MSQRGGLQYPGSRPREMAIVVVHLHSTEREEGVDGALLLGYPGSLESLESRVVGRNEEAGKWPVSGR